MEATLHQVRDRSWQGSLLGYGVSVDWIGGKWWATVSHPKRFTRVQLGGGTVAAAANRARAWIEQNLSIQAGGFMPRRMAVPAAELERPSTTTDAFWTGASRCGR